MATAQGGELAKAMGAVRKAAADHFQRIGESQAALASNIASVGGRELARVQVAHNAIAVRVWNAAQLTQLAALSGVVAVRPVLNYRNDAHGDRAVCRRHSGACKRAGRHGCQGGRARQRDRLPTCSALWLGQSCRFRGEQSGHHLARHVPDREGRRGLRLRGIELGLVQPEVLPRPRIPILLYAGPGRGHGTHVAHIIAGNYGDPTRCQPCCRQGVLFGLYVV